MGLRSICNTDLSVFIECRGRGRSRIGHGYTAGTIGYDRPATKQS